MSDIFDYISFFYCTLLLAVLNFAGFTDLNWWIVAAPSIVGVLLHLLSLIP